MAKVSANRSLEQFELIYRREKGQLSKVVSCFSNEPSHCYQTKMSSCLHEKAWREKKKKRKLPSCISLLITYVEKNLFFTDKFSVLGTLTRQHCNTLGI